MLSNRPLYTRPKPPSPRRHSCLKFFVAAASSRKVKICAAMCVGPSFGAVVSFLVSVPLRDFNFSAKKKKLASHGNMHLEEVEEHIEKIESPASERRSSNNHPRDANLRDRGTTYNLNTSTSQQPSRKSNKRIITTRI